ncbi:hypothetical protein F2Q69_00005554 [Brassica cretica]|uniref:Uncharacterized protein n=1 Tax=Brassica cretica TaxID=69181 RepID=A0A8S9PB95_BRACR|nr:hypothetical protein F2Q69_00005554 [Brassica cretica]
MMMVEPIDFMFRKDAFKTTKASRDFIDVIKRETSNSNREEDDWTTRGSQAYLKSCVCSSINGLVGTETCDFTGEWENAMNIIIEEIFIKMNIKTCSAVFQVWDDQSKKIMEKGYLQNRDSNKERMMQISI